MSYTDSMRSKKISFKNISDDKMIEIFKNLEIEYKIIDRGKGIV